MENGEQCMLWYFFTLQMPDVKAAAAAVVVAWFLNPIHFVDTNSLLKSVNSMDCARTSNSTTADEGPHILYRILFCKMEGSR
jgi:hypothetical protein